MASFSDRLSSSYGGYGSSARPSHSRDPSPRYSSSRSKPDDRYYSDRYSYPHVQTSRPAAVRYRRSWPPSPAVEDEKIALAREANAPASAYSEDDEAQSRGTVDQYPIILDVPEEAARALEKLGYVFAKDRTAGSEHYTYETSEDTPHGLMNGDDVDDGDRGRPRQPSLDAKFADPSLLSRRQPSPYVYTPKAPNLQSGDANDSGYFSGRDMKTPMNAKQSGEHDQKSHDSAKTSSGRSNHFAGAMLGAAAGAATAVAAASTAHKSHYGTNLSAPSRDYSDDAIDSATDDDTPRPIPDRKPARYSSVRTDLQSDELRSSLREMMGKNGPAPRVNALKADPDGHQRSSDVGHTQAKPRFDDPARRPPPLGTLSAHGTALGRGSVPSPTTSQSQQPGNGRKVDRQGSRPSSPVHTSQYMYSPQSPGGSRLGSQNNSPRNGQLSRPGSRQNSRPNSRAGSPTPSDHSRLSGVSDRYEDQPRRTSTYPNPHEDRSQRPSRLSSSTLPPGPDAARLRNLPTPAPATRQNDLPYPDEYRFGMPSEEQHRFDPTRTTSTRPSTSGQDGSGVRNLPYPAVYESDSARMPATPRPSETVPAATSSAIVTQSPISLSESLRSCPRATLSAGHQEWYGLEGLPAFNMCPPCLKANFIDTSFGTRFKRQPRKDRDVKIKCDFASTWMRIAWAITQIQRRTDLNLLYAVAAVEASERPCSGSHTDTRTWYTVVDQRGNCIENFDVCTHDVKMVEALLPSLRGHFVRAYSSSTHRRKCDLRVESKRFPRYLDILIDIHDQALRTRKPAQVEGFVEFASKRAQTRECTRDDLIPDLSWHIIPQLPEFTVCEECYTDVVWPAIAEGSAIAARFGRTPQIFPERVGTSCQLYSPRMRKVFSKAVRHDDFAYLASRTKERKEVEMELQVEFAKVKRAMEELNGQQMSGARGRDAEDWQREIERIASEWKKWE